MRKLHHDFRFWSGHGHLEDRADFVAWLNRSTATAFAAAASNHPDLAV